MIADSPVAVKAPTGGMLPAFAKGAAVAAAGLFVFGAGVGIGATVGPAFAPAQVEQAQPQTGARRNLNSIQISEADLVELSIAFDEVKQKQDAFFENINGVTLAVTDELARIFEVPNDSMNDSMNIMNVMNVMFGPMIDTPVAPLLHFLTGIEAGLPTVTTIPTVVSGMGFNDASARVLNPGETRRFIKEVGKGISDNFEAVASVLSIINQELGLTITNLLYWFGGPVTTVTASPTIFRDLKFQPVVSYGPTLAEVIKSSRPFVRQVSKDFAEVIELVGSPLGPNGGAYLILAQFDYLVATLDPIMQILGLNAADYFLLDTWLAITNAFSFPLAQAILLSPISVPINDPDTINIISTDFTSIMTSGDREGAEGAEGAEGRRLKAIPMMTKPIVPPTTVAVADWLDSAVAGIVSHPRAEVLEFINEITSGEGIFDLAQSLSTMAAYDMLTHADVLSLLVDSTSFVTNKNGEPVYLVFDQVDVVFDGVDAYHYAAEDDAGMMYGGNMIVGWNGKMNPNAHGFESVIIGRNNDWNGGGNLVAGFSSKVNGNHTAILGSSKSSFEGEFGFIGAGKGVKLTGEDFVSYIPEM